LVIDSIGPIVKIEGLLPFAWAKLHLRFLKDGIHPQVDMLIPLIYEDGNTIQQIHELIFDAAKDLITAAATALTGRDSAGLRQLSAELEDPQASA
jgi:hypothetical protein